MRALFFIAILFPLALKARDTVFVHPKYPPLVYQSGEYRFYKYTAKYIPQNMLEAFKLLATAGSERLSTFANRTQDQVVKHGMFQSGFRLRKEFCLDGYSTFTAYFHQKGIYYPFAMKTYLLLCFHQYLNCERIAWRNNKKIALYNKRELNRAWKKKTKARI